MERENKKFTISIKCRTKELADLFCSCSDLSMSSINDNTITYNEVEMFMPLMVLGYKDRISTKSNEDNNFDISIECADKNTSTLLYNLSYKLLSPEQDFIDNKVLLNHDDNKVYIKIKSDSNCFPRFVFSFK